MNNKLKTLAFAFLLSLCGSQLSAQVWLNGGQNSNMMFPSSMACRIGIGIGAPTAALHVVGNGNQSALFESGKVGIGTASPIDQLHIVNHANDRSWIRVENNNGGNSASAALSLGGHNNAIPGWNGVVHTYMGAGYVGSGVIGTNWQNKAVSYLGSGTAGFEFHCATPSQTMEWTRYNGSSYQVDMTLDANGRLGLGTSNPDGKLHVNGDFVLTDGSQTAGYVLSSDASGKASWVDPASVFSGGGGTSNPSCTTPVTTLANTNLNICNSEVLETGSGGDKLYLGSSGGTQPISWAAYPSASGYLSRTSNTFAAQIDYRPWSNRMVFNFSDSNTPTYGSAVNFNTAMEIRGANSPTSTPQVVIGGENTNPAHSASMLMVNGKIVCSAISVTDAQWADFVFEDDYELMPLEEVEEFIAENGHLPNIPSAAEVEENGVSLGQMDANLLRKIEELTLYMLEMEKENDQLRDRLEQIESAAK